MNDIGYDTSIKFKGSCPEVNLELANKEQLEYMLPYYKNAVNFHTKENNTSQIEFFGEGEKLINKRLLRINKKNVIEL